MPEIGLGIGRYISVSGGGTITEELIGLYDEQGNRQQMNYLFDWL